VFYVKREAFFRDREVEWIMIQSCSTAKEKRHKERIFLSEH
jgi:hypothetical protein